MDLATYRGVPAGNVTVDLGIVLWAGRTHRHDVIAADGGRKRMIPLR